MVSTSPQPKRTNDPHGLRRRVLDTAAELFQSKGFNATGMQDIAQGAGVTSGAMHHHFPTKKAIALAVLRERVAPSVEEAWIAPLLAAPSTADGVAVVFGTIQEGLDARGTVRGCPLNNLALELSLADPDLRAEIQRVFTDWRAAVAAKVRSDQAAGRCLHLDPDDFATFAVAAYSGAMAISKAEQGTDALKVCGARLIEEAHGAT